MIKEDLSRIAKIIVASRREIRFNRSSIARRIESALYDVMLFTDIGRYKLIEAIEDNKPFKMFAVPNLFGKMFRPEIEVGGKTYPLTVQHIHPSWIKKYFGDFK